MMPLNMLEDNGHYVPAPYILSMGCVSGDEVQIAVHRREDIVSWLKQLDHEGSSWSVVEHVFSNGTITETRDLTADIEREYAL